MKKTEADISAIVSLIYENIFAPKYWIGLAEPIGVNGARSRTDHQFTEFLDPAYLDRVVPYLEHALEIADRRQDVEKAQASRAALFQDFPLPVCIVSADLTLLSASNNASVALQQGKLLSEKAGKLMATGRGLQEALSAAVASSIKTGQSRALNCMTESGIAQSILVVPASWGGADADNSTAALFLNFSPGDIKELAEALADEHGLTRSEAEVAAYLAQGISLDEIAGKKSASINTVRTQLKSIFAKTGTGRQGELVSLVLNGPALWLRLFQVGNGGQIEASPKVEGPGPDTGGALRLVDGRLLSYGDYGPRDGKPVILCHHLLGSRREKPDDESLLERLGVRLIVPERPGVGLSTASDNSSLAGWVEDIRQLADHLGLQRFSILGYSTGGPYAAACAALLKGRVTRLGLVASLMPIDELPEGTETSLLQRFLTGLARHWPSGIRTLIEFRYKKLLADPDETLARFKLHGNSADAELLNDPQIAHLRLQNLKEASRLPKRVFADVLVTLSRPWGFRISEIEVPVAMWHGRQDDFFSCEHTEAISGIIPDCDTVFGDHWGHFFLYQEWESVLAWMADGGR